MSKKFTASNGIQVTSEVQSISGFRRIRFGGHQESVTVELSGRNIRALVEHLDHERDTALGRWRYPDSPHLVVYPQDDGWVAVVDEEAATAYLWQRERLVECPAAQAYFDTHPEPKPWHDAKPGEVWEITIHGRRHGGVVASGGFLSTVTSDGDAILFDLSDRSVTAGRRIWPEAS